MPFVLPSAQTCALLCLLLLLTACQAPSAQEPAPPPRTVTRVEKGYALTFPHPWKTFAPAVFGEHTDLALLHDDRHFAVVVEPATGAGLEAFTQTSLGVFGAEVLEFELLRQVDIVLDGKPAVTIFATGEVKDHVVHYSITYAVTDSWRYHLVAWTAPSRASQLALDVDTLLAGWRFLP